MQKVLRKFERHAVGKFRRTIIMKMAIKDSKIGNTEAVFKRLKTGVKELELR